LKNTISASLVSSVKAEEGQICILGVICENRSPVGINPKDPCFMAYYKVCEKMLSKKKKKREKREAFKKKILKIRKELLYNL